MACHKMSWLIQPRQSATWFQAGNLTLEEPLPYSCSYQLTAFCYRQKRIAQYRFVLGKKFRWRWFDSNQVLDILLAQSCETEVGATRGIRQVSRGAKSAFG